MKKRTVAENIAQNERDALIQGVLEILDADDGKSAAEKREAIIAHFESIIAEEKKELAVPKKCIGNQTEIFWKDGQIVYSESDIVLRSVEDADRDGFIKTQQEYSVMKSMLRDESFRNMIWKEHIEDKALMLSILQNGTYVGYCGIKDCTCEPWEIVIEILPEWTRRGIGFKAISGMLDACRNRLGVTRFRVRIDPGNYASQKLFEKLGAVPNGLSTLWIHEQELLEECEEEHLHMIDDQLILVAEKFNVAPRKLLSHILEYTLEW